MSFLKAEWKRLAFANYVVSPDILQPYVPSGTELDYWEDKCYVSLVGFMFQKVSVLGVKIPFHINFEEFNLRFYVKRWDGTEWKRGVVFIKEIVPKPAISWIANVVYKENYVTLPMKHLWKEEQGTLKTEYEFKLKTGWQHIKLLSEMESTPIVENSEVEFITEHYWGYAKKNDQTTNEYEVKHPKWKHHKVLDYSIKVDCKQLYGDEFHFLSDMEPTSVFLADGSDISVEGKTTIKTV
jgi:uncharacterized protein YqjF (DUF2071 family)